MSASRLREAAALIRERAEAATPGPWEQDTRNPDDIVMGGRLNAFTGSNNVEPDVAHIASWHPAVALAVADWLKIVAVDVEKKALSIPDERAALAVANAYLGDPS